ncbi:MAG: MFS transporter [Clostridiaceae bacterium]|nr:MFS transporter [Clostridiaceae bacterium]
MNGTDKKHGYGYLVTNGTLYYAACGAYTYLSVYLKTGPGFTTAQIGILLALGQVVASFSPVFWGYLADRSKNRNTIWMVVIAGSVIGALLVPISRQFLFVAAALIFVNCFQSSISGMQDSVTTELCANNRWDLGRSRMLGTVAYAITTFAVGAYLSTDNWELFALYSAIFAVSLIPIALLPKVPGYQSGGHRVPYRKLFEEPKLVIIFLIAFALNLTTSFYYSFFSVYFISPEVGGTTTLFGICNGLASLAEFPGVFFFSKVERKIGLNRLMLGAMGFLALRWLLIGLVPNPYALIFINMLHGVSYGVVALAVVVYINRVVRPEFRASAQGFNTMLTYGITRVIASLFGGFLASAFPFSSIFVVLSGVVAAVTIGYLLYLKKTDTLRE